MAATVFAGEHSVTSDDAAARAATIVSGLTTITTVHVQIFRNHSETRGPAPAPTTTILRKLPAVDADVTFSGGSFLVENYGSMYEMRAGDILRWIACGS